MALAHTGIAVTIVGITIVSSYENEINVKMALNDKVEISGYEIEFVGIKKVEGPNYSAEQGQMKLYKDNKYIGLMQPERRSYRVQSMGMTEAAINPGLFRDVYIALGDPLGGGAWSVRAHYKPFVRWIWLGALFMGFGGLLTMLDKRYRSKNKTSTDTKQVSSASIAATAATSTLTSTSEPTTS